MKQKYIATLSYLSFVSLQDNLLDTRSKVLAFWEFFQKIGDDVFGVSDISKLCFRRVLGYEPDSIALARFVAECKNVVSDYKKEIKPELIATFLVPSAKYCFKCKKVMKLDQNKVSVICYDEENRARQGWRQKKVPQLFCDRFRQLLQCSRKKIS